MRKVRLCLTQSLSLLFCAFAVCDVNVRADIARKLSSGRVSWNATLNHPTVLTIGSPQPVLHAERSSRFEGGQEAVVAPLQIVRMHTLGPSQAYLLFHGSARKLEPRLIKIIAKTVGTRHPYQDGRSISHRLEPGLALTQAFL